LFFKRTISKLSDEELLTHYAQSGDTEYFGELYNRYIPLLYGLCLKYLQDEDRAQEAVMQLFEDLLPKLGNYEIKVFKLWLYRVAKNHCLQLLRKENKEIPLDYTINIMESDEFLHLLSEEESSEESITSLSRKVARRTTDEHYTFLFRGNVVCGYCRADRIYSE
jgi:RNA polymerase sigma-70 factor (ECF subfamily)